MATSVTGKATEFIQFTRASNATVTDIDGKVKWAPHNLLTNSESFDASAWPKNAITVTANSVAAPNGTTTADTILDTAVSIIHWTGQSITGISPAGQTVTVSAFCKANTLNYVTLGISDISVGNLYATAVFNLSNGTVATTGASGTGYSVVGTPTITSAGSGWYLCTVTVVAGTSVSYLNAVIGLNKTGVISATAGGFESYLGNGSGIYVWGAACYRSDMGMQANTSAYPMYNPTTPKNLLGYTEDFSNAAWTKTATTITSNVVLAPNGLQTADKVVATAASGFHGVRQGFTYGTGTYTISIYAKAAEYTKLYISDLSLGHAFAAYDLVSGTVISSGGGPKLVSANIEAAPNGFFRCLLVVTNVNVSSTPTFVGYPTGATLSANGADYTGDGTSGIYIWGAQISDSASLDTYSPVYGAAVTSAAYYGPRRDFDPVTLACKGLLVEEQRTNLLLHSADFTQAAWTKFNLNTSGTPAWSNVAVAPDGTQTAEKLIANTTNSAHWVGGSATITSGVAYTVSAYVKSGADVGDYTFASLYDCNASTYIIVNLATGAFVSGTASAYTITPVGSGWYRLSVTATSSSTTGYNRVYLYDGTTTNFAGNDAKGIYAWGLQLEAGSFATSYIPTGAATASRNGDVASVSTQAFPYNSTDGTWVANFQTIFSGASTGSYYLLNLDGNANKRVLYIGSGAEAIASFDGTTIVGTGTDITGPISKSANAYTSSERAVVSNGLTVITGASVASYATASTVNIGSTGNISGVGPLNGHIRQITYLPRRISNTELQTRTA